jgi:hypothetical protein
VSMSNLVIMLFNNMHKTSKKKDLAIKYGYKDLLEVNLDIIC